MKGMGQETWVHPQLVDLTNCMSLCILLGSAEYVVMGFPKDSLLQGD